MADGVGFRKSFSRKGARKEDPATRGSSKVACVTSDKKKQQAGPLFRVASVLRMGWKEKVGPLIKLSRLSSTDLDMRVKPR